MSLALTIHANTGIMSSNGFQPQFLCGKGNEGTLTVQLMPGESQEGLLRRFRKAVTQSGVLTESRKRRWFVSKSELRRRAKKKAIRKARRDQRRSDYQER